MQIRNTVTHKDAPFGRAGKQELDPVCVGLAESSDPALGWTEYDHVGQQRD